jgi:hypothetical protein
LFDASDLACPLILRSNVEKIADLPGGITSGYATDREMMRFEATMSAVNEWTDHVLALGQGQLMNEVGSWMTGVNRNVEGKQKPRVMRYSGGDVLPVFSSGVRFSFPAV